MSGLCLPPNIADKFKQAFVKGEIDPAKLASMTSEERHNFFKGFSDKESATTINSLFESKLLLKNQQKGFASWAKTLVGMNAEAQRGLLARIQRIDRVLSEPEKEAFLKDLAATKLGVSVSHEEAQHIAMLSKNIENATDKVQKGRSVYDLHNYVGDLTNEATKLKLADIKGKGITRVPGFVAKKVNDISKAIGASLDNSFSFRQGLKSIFTNPGVWQKEFRKSFVNIVKAAKNTEEAKRELFAHLYADPDYETAVKAGLFKQDQDVFPSSAPEKLPIIGRAFGASEVAYSAYSDYLRFGIFKQNLRKAEKFGVNIKDKEELRNIAKLSNSLGGHGTFKGAEHVASKVAPAFYSLRFLKSNFDTLALHPLGVGVGGLGSFAQKEAAKNLAKIVVGIAGVLAVADTLKPGSVEWDPRSSDFGKIRVGSTRFDVSGGMGSIITLAARLGKQSSKSSTSHQVTQLNSGAFGARTEWEVFTDFFANKLSPAGGVVRDKLKGQDPSGNKFTAGNEAKSLVEPLGFKNFQELQQGQKTGSEHAANTLTSMILDGLGVSTNTYTSTQPGSFLKSTGKEVTDFKNKVGMDQFKKAAADYDKKINDETQRLVNDPNYKKLSTDDQKAVITKEKAKVQGQIFNKYDFKYKRAKPQKDKFKSLL